MMNIKLHKIYVILAIAAFCLLLSTGALAAKGVEVKLVGQDDVDVDRQAIQNAINSAPANELTVKLKGTFQLDGLDILINRSDLTIKGDKGGATLKGKLGPDDLPIDDRLNFPNRGFLIESSSPLRKIEIKDLALTGFRSAIFARGQLNEIHDVSIKNNRMENSIFGVSVIGDVSNIKISDNDVNGVIETSVKAFSTSAGNVSDIKIVKNYFADAAWDAINIADIDGAIISDNFLSTTDENDFPIVFVALGANTNVVVEDNVLRGGAMGMILLGDANDFIVTRNCIMDGGTQGDSFFSGGGIQIGFSGEPPSSGFEIMDNSYDGNVATLVQGARDVWLTVDSKNNSVTERVGTVVLDEGVLNTVGDLADDGVDHCSD